MSELWKKKLLDEQRTHVLKASNCTVKTIKYYFEQIWSQIITEKHDEEENEEPKSFEEKCRQAFQQAQIQIKTMKKRIVIKLTPKRNSKKINQSNHQPTTMDVKETVDQLNQLITMVSHMREQITSGSLSQILKMNNHMQQSIEGKCKQIA